MSSFCKLQFTIPNSQFISQHSFNVNMISQTFLFEYTATCNDGFYVCNVKTMRSNGDVVETALAIAESPILEGCESMYYICMNLFVL